MKVKKFILDQILYVVNLVVCLFPIKENQVTFVSLESNKLEQDMLQIYEEIQGQYQVKTVLMEFRENTLWSNFRYMMNTLKQVWYINRSKVVVIHDNNYVISKFKRKGVQVVQVWHATGAIKKFGNCLPREYKINNYDYVIANGDYWAEPYSQAFGVRPSQVKVLGMPRIDRLFQPEYIQSAKMKFYKKYPQLEGKHLILYAPTFRGNIYKGFQSVSLDGEKLVDILGEDYVLLYKYHPLLTHAREMKHERCIDVTQEELYTLFSVSYMMISDYSSIILDYSVLEKPMIFYTPDLEAYGEEVGYFVDCKNLPGPICLTTEEVIKSIYRIHTGLISESIAMNMKQEMQEFHGKYFRYRDGNNTKRVVEFLQKLM